MYVCLIVITNIYAKLLFYAHKEGIIFDFFCIYVYLILICPKVNINGITYV